MNACIRPRNSSLNALFGNSRNGVLPERDRSAAPAWWWQPAFEVREQQEQMTPLSCHRLELPLSSTYAAGAAVLMMALADQTSLPWADEFPRKIERAKKSEEDD
jgi:hypothetical protein